VIIPWLAEAIDALTAAHAGGRLPHALLIHAVSGVGGDWLAGWAAQLALCTASDRRPCGECTGCRRAAAGQHPDLISVCPSEDSQQIRIEQVRELSAELALTSHQGGYRVAIISPADSLNRFAANALLKTLEEPPPRTLLTLVAAQPSRLPATIVSRCQRIRIRQPSRAQSVAWLTATRGEAEWSPVLDVIGEAPFSAATLDPVAVAKLDSEVRRTLAEVRAGSADPVTIAERWSRAELPLRLACLENWLTECIRGALTGPKQAREMRDRAHTGAAGSVINSRALYQLLDAVRELKGALSTPINRSLALESLLRSLGSFGPASTERR
jgi:DNA polymerase-3 subunit delta'